MHESEASGAFEWITGNREFAVSAVRVMTLISNSDPIACSVHAFVRLPVFRKQLQRVDDDKARGFFIVDGDDRFDSAFQLYVADASEMLA